MVPGAEACKRLVILCAIQASQEALLAGSKRDKIKMTPDEVDAYLADNFKVQIATVGKDGEPHLVTMFYTLLDGKIAFTTYKASQKVLNLRRNPTMTCLVEDGVEYGELRGVALYGRGLVIEDPKTAQQGRHGRRVPHGLACPSRRSASRSTR